MFKRLLNSFSMWSKHHQAGLACGNRTTLKISGYIPVCGQRTTLNKVTVTKWHVTYHPRAKDQKKACGELTTIVKKHVYGCLFKPISMCTDDN